MNLRDTGQTFTDVDLVTALLDSSLPIAAAPIDEGQMVRYAFGWATDEEEAVMIEALTLSSDLRQALIAIQASIKQPESCSLAVRQFLTHSVECAVRAYGELERGLGDWKSNLDESLVVLHALQAGKQRSVLGFNGWAATRSAAALRVRDETGLGYLLQGRTSPTGTLEIEGRRPSTETGLDATVRLDWIDQVLGPIPLGLAAPHNGSWRLSIEDFGKWDDASLRASEFLLVRGDEPLRTAFAELPVRTETGDYVQVPLLSPPVASKGRVLLRCAFCETFRKANAELVLELAFNAGPLLVPLRAWTVSELPTDGVLTAPFPSAFEGALPRGAVVAELHDDSRTDRAF